MPKANRKALKAQIVSLRIPGQPRIAEMLPRADSLYTPSGPKSKEGVKSGQYPASKMPLRKDCKDKRAIVVRDTSLQTATQLSSAFPHKGKRCPCLQREIVPVCIPVSWD